MFELCDLYRIIKISECGTISRAAEELYISQPALSRAMRHLEEELGVELFERTGNKAALNETGRFFVKLAGSLAADCEDAVRRVRRFDSERNCFKIASCAPAPLWKLAAELTPRLGDRRISTEVTGGARASEGLLGGEYDMAITDGAEEGDDIAIREYCRERLYLYLPPEHRLAHKDSVTFADIDGITMLLFEGIGVWKDVRARLPHTHFIVQQKYGDFTDLVSQSMLPSFITDLAMAWMPPEGRIAVPVDGEGAEHVFYVAVRKADEKYLSGIGFPGGSRG